ncbi:MAG: hypothetical protein ABR586_09480 [Thermoplasmatota archaeon]
MQNPTPIPGTPPKEAITFGPWVKRVGSEQMLYCWTCSATTCKSNHAALGFESLDAAKTDAGHHNRIFHEGRLTIWERIDKDSERGQAIAAAQPGRASATAFLRLVATKQVRTQQKMVERAAKTLGLTVENCSVPARGGGFYVGHPRFTGPGGTFAPAKSKEIGNAQDAARALQAAGLPVEA